MFWEIVTRGLVEIISVAFFITACKSIFRSHLFHNISLYVKLYSKGHALKNLYSNMYQENMQNMKICFEVERAHTCGHILKHWKC